MFGMSSTDFWENDPQLYWAYRTFYLKQKEVEIEQNKYNAWLCGSINHLSTSLAINNNFSKSSKKYPTYEELFDNNDNNNNNNNIRKGKMTKKEIDKMVQDEFNAWARY